MPRKSTRVCNLGNTRTVGALKRPSTGQIDYFDEALKGFGIRVSAAGRMTWFVMYRDSDGRRQRYNLGTYPTVTVKRARTDARTALESVSKGGNPAKEKRERKMADTFAELAAAYIRHYAQGEAFATWQDGKAIVEKHPDFIMKGRELVIPPTYKGNIDDDRRPITAYLKAPDNPPAPRKRSWRKDQNLIDRDLLPEWRHRKAETITRADVNRLLDKIVDRGAPIQANRALEVIRKLFSWAIGESRVRLDANPCSEIKKRGVETPRDRHLSADEIKAMWPMVGTKERPAKITDATRLALRLMLTTGQRPGEVLGMAWAELDGDWQDAEKPSWVIPANRSKNGRAHSVPLSPLAVDLLTEAKALADGSPYVFPSPRGKGAMQVSSLSHALSRSEHFGIEPFTSHDLRRTVATHLEGPECGISRFIVSRILNHADQSVTGRHYSQYQHDTEKRAALNTWARRLSEIVTGSKPEGADVVPLKKAGGE